ncbi:hypothetical protein F5Y03DRAFT_373885 [Xylaria venustula]|nr:hypothetical protein F5Y03DRAFT_373885 [Xylaria venustula]
MDTYILEVLRLAFLLFIIVILSFQTYLFFIRVPSQPPWRLDTSGWGSTALREWSWIHMSWSFFNRESFIKLPVIFLAPPDHTQGPEEGEIWYIDGSIESYKRTGTEIFDYLCNSNGSMSDNKASSERAMAFSNNKASWLGLLEVLQRMERQSISWESAQWRKATTTDGPFNKVKITSLAVGVQLRKHVHARTWISRRPCATTTICHLVELAAVLGIYWKQFDRYQDKYRAEGNGLALRGTRVENIGLVFTFEQTGRIRFEEKRVIPTSDVKELCFGSAPTFYRPRNTAEDMAWQDASTTRRQMSLQTLHLGSTGDVLATLAMIGCNEKTISRFSGDERHLFPVLFEIVGMLCRTYHLKNRCFTYLPNPTKHYWNKRELSLRRLLSEFRRELLELIGNLRGHSPSDLEYIALVVEELDSQLPDEYQQLNPMHLNQLHDAISRIDNILMEYSDPKAIILDVIRRHLQEVLQAIKDLPSAFRRGEKNPLMKFFLLPPEHREGELMRVYFSAIRQSVIILPSSLTDVVDTVSASLMIHLKGKGGPQNDDHGDFNDKEKIHRDTEQGTSSGGVGKAEYDVTSFELKRNTIWCALVLRMICWLTLHDFDEEDTQLSMMGEVQGSSLPVYIE